MTAPVAVVTLARMRGAWLAVLGVALLGCGSQGERGERGPAGEQGEAGPVGADGKQGPIGPAGPAGKDGLALDGSRLKARMLVGADGSKSPTGAWLDTMTGGDCTFGVATDGKTRCLPPVVPGFQIRWADAACTQPLLITTKGDAGPPMLPEEQTFVVSPNSLSVHYVQPGAPAAPPAEIYVYGCVPGDPSAIPDLAFWSVTILPASFFVSATVQ
jgi:hypothetical protein